MRFIRSKILAAALAVTAAVSSAADPPSRLGAPAARLPPPAGATAPSKAEIRPAASGVNVSTARVSPPQTSIAALKPKFDAFANGASKYEIMAKQLPTVFKQCFDKAYSAQDQQKAGCLPTDPVQQCAAKLVKYCLANYSTVMSIPTLGIDGGGGGVATYGFSMQQFLQSGQATAAEARALSQLLNLYAGQVEQAVKTAVP